MEVARWEARRAQKPSSLLLRASPILHLFCSEAVTDESAAPSHSKAGREDYACAMETLPVLRPLGPGDAADVMTGFQADPQMRRQGDVRDLDSASRYIEFVTNDDQGNAAFAVDLEGRCIGVIALSGASAHRLGWFFYWMHPDFRGRGITSRAAATVADWALTAGGFERLELGHRANNPASGRVALAAGFLHEGVDREKLLIDGERVDALTYGRLRSDPFPLVTPLPLRAP